MSGGLKRTPLYEEHKRLGARLVPFAGYEMPIQYPAGILAEHQAVRQRAGLFDVSHMGELEVRGEDPLGLVQQLTTNDAARLAAGQAQYSVICDDDGTAIDDCLVYRFPDHYLVVVNASNQDEGREWFRKAAPRFGCEVLDRSDQTALLALQGPAAARILARITDVDLEALGYYHFQAGAVDRRPAVISRTGYTGEDGFELYISAEFVVPVWDRLLEAGEQDGLMPAGLGARDSLRLEMGYALHGNDLDRQHTPLEAGLGWVVKLDKPGGFIGRDALARQKEEGVRQKLVGFVLREKGFPRPGYEVRWRDEAVGRVTSGTVSPSLGIGIGMAYVPAEAARAGTELAIVIRDRPSSAEVVRPPFYKEGSVKK